MIPGLSQLMIVVGSIVVGFWLWYGIEVYHCFWYDGPLAAAGYIGWLDNLFKCSVLFGWSIYWMIPDIEYSSWFILVVGIATIWLFRSLVMWRS